MKSYKRLKNIFKKMSHLHYVQRILMWDESVMMPVGAGKYRAQALSTFNGLSQKIIISRKIKELIEDAKTETDLSQWDVANLKWMEKKYISAACIPLKLTKGWTQAMLACRQAWRQHRSENNWREFSPFLDKSFKLVKEIASRKSDVLHIDPYDVLLEDYSPGFNQKNLDAIFSTLKDIMPNLRYEISVKQQREKILVPVGPFSIEKQRNIGLRIMSALQFNFQHGRLDVSHHPFCDGTPTDVRITTRYNEENFITSLLSTCHETGHALYEQGLPLQWIDQPVGKIQSKALHESQSLLIENEVCYSRAFLQYILTIVKKEFGSQEAFTVDNLFKIMTQVQPSLIRINADEVTYPLHIILRYEIEKKLLNGDISIKDLPMCWDELMVKYLGISTKGNDKDGVMQDVHWPAGLFGYFPSYTLGRLIAAQLFSTFKNVHPSFYDEIKEGDFQSIKCWLKENVYNHAALLDTNELLVKATGEPLNAEHFIKHIKNRYLSDKSEYSI